MDQTVSNSEAQSALFPDLKQPQNLVPEYNEDQIRYLGEPAEEA